MIADIILSIICVALAILVVWSDNPIISALSLFTMFIVMAGIFFQLGTTFLTAIQVIVYAGAIAILFVFVLMLLNLSDVKKSFKKNRYRPIIGLLSLSVTLGFMWVLIRNNMDLLFVDKIPSTDMLDLFFGLFEKYLVPFELATVLLLAAIVAVVTNSKERFLNENEED